MWQQSKPPPKAKPASKAPVKPKATTTKAKIAPKKVLADHNDNTDDGGVDVDLAHVPESSGAGPSAPEKKKTKTASETYTMVCSHFYLNLSIV